MKRILIALGLLVGATVGVTVATTASATPPPLPLCSGWYVNPDEAARAPEQLSDGLKFEPGDLVHRAVANLPVASLVPGTYAASPAPGQPSFFSVEVRNPSGAYGTLRWDPTASLWSITIGAGTGPGGAATDGTFTNANPVSLLAGKVTKWGAFSPATDVVVSFGVGFTANPPGTVTTKVTSVTFQGTTYPTLCLPPTSSASASASSSSKPPSQSASASASSSKSASTSASVSATPSSSSTPPVVGAGSGRLPTTGSSWVPWLIGSGVALLLVGAGLLAWLWRRNRTVYVS